MSRNPMDKLPPWLLPLVAQVLAELLRKLWS